MLCAEYVQVPPVHPTASAGMQEWGCGGRQLHDTAGYYRGSAATEYEVVRGDYRLLSDLCLLSFSPWGVFDVCCDNMRGVEKGLDWVLHHLAKKRREWTYHSMQGQNG